MNLDDKKYSIFAIVGIVLTAISACLVFCGSYFVYAMFPTILFAIATLVFAIIGRVKAKGIFSTIVLIVSIVIFIITALFFEMLFEYIYIL